MAAFTGKANGNWSAVGQTTWNEVGTPAAGDTVDLNGKTVAMDIADIPAGGGTLLSLSSTGAGVLTVAMNVLGDSTISATTITQGTATMLTISGAAPANTLTITGDLVAGSTNSTYCLVSTSTCGVVIVGDITGGGGSVTMGAYLNNVNADWTVTGDITGGSGTNGWGLTWKSVGTLTVTGNVTGGSGVTANGIDFQLAGAVNVTGTVTGGSAKLSQGINNKSTGTVTVVGNMVRTTEGNAVCGELAWEPGPYSYMELPNATRLRNPRRTILL